MRRKLPPEDIQAIDATLASISHPLVLTNFLQQIHILFEKGMFIEDMREIAIQQADCILMEKTAWNQYDPKLQQKLQTSFPKEHDLSNSNLIFQCKI